MGLIKKLRKAKKEAPPNEKPAVVKTHLRDMIIVPEMIGSVVGIYNGKVRGDFFMIGKMDGEGRSVNLTMFIFAGIQFC
jgi:ribosomal protein S19